MIKHIRKTYSLDGETVKMLEWIEKALNIRYSAILRDLIREKYEAMQEDNNGSLSGQNSRGQSGHE